MSLEDLYEKFNLAAREKHIGGNIMSLMGKLVATLGVKELPLFDGETSRLPDAVRLVGNTHWPEHLTKEDILAPDWTVSLTGTVNDPDQNVLTLELQAHTERGFVAIGALVPDLPHSRVPDPDVGGGIKLGDSVLADLGPEQAVLTTTAADDASSPLPQLSGWLVLDHLSLKDTPGILGTARLPLSGTIDPRTEAETADKVNLNAIAPLAKTGWASKLNLQSIALRLTTNYVDFYSWESPYSLSSAALIVLQVQVRTPQAHTVEISVSPYISSQVLDLNGDIDPPLSLSDGIAGLVGLFPGASPNTFSLPSGLAPLNAFGLSHLRVGMNTQKTTIGSFTAPIPTGLAYTGITLESKTKWDLPIPYLSIEDVGASWLVRWDGAAVDYWSGSLYGTMLFGSKEDPNPEDEKIPTKAEPYEDDVEGWVELDVTVGLPDLNVEAKSRHPFAMSLTKAMTWFFPGTQPDVDDGLVVDFISMGASLYGKTFSANLRVHGDWSIPVGNIRFDLEEIEFSVTSEASSTWGGLMGMVGVYAPPPPSNPGQEDDPVQPTQQALLSMGAYYPGDGSWKFQGGLAGKPIDLIQFVYAFLGQEPPTWLQGDSGLNVELTRLWAEYSTETGNPYSVSAALAVRWEPDILGIKLGLAAETDIVYRKAIKDDSPAARHDALLLTADDSSAEDQEPDMVTEGSVKGAFRVNNLTVTAGVSLQDNEQTWLFRVELDSFLLEGCSAYIGTGDDRHQVIRVEMQGVTLGVMISSFAALANPNANYRLPEPWTFLDDINMGHFVLLVDPSKQTVRLDYHINLHLGFLTLKSVGLNYDRSSGEPKVNIEIFGSFLGKDYGKPGEEPLSWDALNDSPPEVPGEGNALVDLRYMGLGQHVSLDDLTNPDSVADVLSLMRAQMKPMDTSLRNPLDQPSGSQLHFDEGSQWLIGLDITAMDTAKIQLVLHDTDLYGALIELSGPQAGALAGFSFELLYKKVTDDIGVFHGRLQVPKSFRHLNFGAVALTLGIISADIYTNGNFKVDLGFPHNRNWKNSFGLTYGAFSGMGGIYFAMLDGNTSSKTPAIANGAFSPVLELGVGLAVRTGYEVKEGPLQGSLYVRLEVIFEGVLAWFHPDDAAASEAMYYQAQGMAKLVGKLCAKVNFKVIAIDISLDAVASVTLAMEAYRRTLIEMFINVEAHARVKVGFVKVSFSFKVRLNASFIVGSNTTTPWVLSGESRSGSGSSRGKIEPVGLHAGTPPHANASRRSGFRSRRGRGDMARLLRQSRGAHHPLVTTDVEPDPCADYRLTFSPTVKVFEAIQSLDVRMLPAFTIADMPVVWPGAEVETQNPDYQIVMLLTMDGPAPLHAETLAESRYGPFNPTARADTQAETPFATLASGLFRWALSSLGLALEAKTMLDAGHLAELAAQLDCPQTFAEGFSFSNLSAFLANNLCLRISGVPEGDTPDDMTGVCFPIPPVLNWVSDDLPEGDSKRDFATYQPVDNAYADQIAATFSPMSPIDGDDMLSGGITTGESLASVMFREYLLLITKSMVQASTNLFAAFPVDLDDKSTLTGISADFPTATVPYVVRQGDTSDQVAAHYGYSEEELLALNPTLPDTLDKTAPGAQIKVVLGVTPEGIAAANPSWPLADKSIAADALQTQILEGDTAETLCTRLGAKYADWLQDSAALDAPITRADAPLSVPKDTFDNPTGLTLTQVAALTYVRFNAGTDVVTQAPRVNWYAEAITWLNDTLIGAEGALPGTVDLPASFNGLDQDPITWTRLVGDTLGHLAAVTALWQNPNADPEFQTWLDKVTLDNPDHKDDVTVIPDSQVRLLPDETLRDLAARLLRVVTADMTGLSADARPGKTFRDMVHSAPILTPLAPVVVTDCALDSTHHTIGSFATHYDLPIETAGRLGADKAGWFLPGDNPLPVPHLAAVTLETLMPKVLEDAPIRDVAGQVSRFMMHGQRLPKPADETNFAGLYDLVGQQIPGPAPKTGGAPDTVRLTLEVKSNGVKWVVLVNTETAKGSGDFRADLAGYQIRFPDFALFNPAAAAGGLRPGLVLDMGDIADQCLTIPITESMLEAGYPATTLQPKLGQNPGPMPLYQDMPVRHGLPQQVFWNTAQTLNLAALKEPAVGMPSFWPLTFEPSEITAWNKQVACQVYRTDPSLGPDGPAEALENFTWATTIGIRINRVPGSPHLVDVVGADGAGRQVLLALWQYLKENEKTDDATLWVSFARSPAAGLASGLSSPAIDADATYVVRTNLSTHTHSGPAQVRAEQKKTAPSGPFFAPISNACGFLTLLWEASVVGGGGYWLNLSDQQGDGFPEDLFDPDGRAVLFLTAVLDTQACASPNLQLHPFTTAALVSQPIDASSSVLFVAARDNKETTRIPTLAPGNVGFTFDIENPSDVEEGADVRARRLYSLAGYQLAAAEGFDGSGPGRPVGPQVDGDSGNDNNQTIAQVIPIHRFAKKSLVPQGDGLPLPERDPYAGIAAQGTEQPATVPVVLCFQDVFGNRTAGNGDKEEKK